MQAIILAAGRGTRLKKYFNYPKTLIKINKKETLIERICKQLREVGVKKIHIVTGYKHKMIKNILKNKATYHYFKNFRKSNNLQSLLFVKKILNEPTLCLFADIVFETKILKMIVKSSKNIVLNIKSNKILKDTMRVKIYKKNISDIGNHIKIKDADGNFIGIAKFSKVGVRLLKKYLIRNRFNFKDYYTKSINDMIRDGIKIKFINTKKLFWKEIDTIKDYRSLNKLKIYEK